MKPIDAYDKTLVQLASAAVVLIPYLFLTETSSDWSITLLPLGLLLLVGVLHTGIAYTLYFGSFDKLSSQTVAILGYIDPVIAVLLSALLLREPMDLWQGVGAVLVLAASLGGELLPAKKS